MDNYEQERNGNFSFTKEELNGKTIIQAITEKCLEMVLYDLEKSGITISNGTAQLKH